MKDCVVFKIQRYCIDDGPGIRTTVFLKGCPLKCQWCHNPEGLSSHVQVTYDDALCIGCRVCESVCPNSCHVFKNGKHLFLRDDCIACGKCASVCPVKALEMAGKRLSVGDVMKVVARDVVFYRRSGGGMTLSGGEPLMHSDFSFELCKAAKEMGIHTAVETCCFSSMDVIEKMIPVVDLFLCDYKETSTLLHKEFTGDGNEQILENIRRIDEAGKPIVLRCPLIPGRNMRPEHYLGISTLASNLKNLVRVELEPYHSFGLLKREKLGISADYSNTKSLEVEEACKVAEEIRTLASNIEVLVKR